MEIIFGIICVISMFLVCAWWLKADNKNREKAYNKFLADISLLYDTKLKEHYIEKNENDRTEKQN